MENRAEQLIEAYFANSLTPPESLELREMVAGNPALAAEFAFQQRLAEQLQTASLIEGIQQKSWKAILQKPSGTAIRAHLFPRYLYAAAAALAILVVGYLFLQPPGLSTLVADNAKEYPNKMKFKSLGEEAQQVPKEVIQAFAFYDRHAFAEAAKALQPIVAANPERTDYRLYWGVSMVMDKQYAAAVSILTPLVQSSNEQSVPALYYLGLACAGSGDKACARQNLQSYIDSPEGVSFRKQAQAVMEAL